MRLLTSAVLLAISSAGFAAPKTPAEVVAPFIDEGTFLIVRVEPAKLDLDPALKLALQHAGKIAGEGGGLAAEAPAMAVRGAGAVAKGWLTEYGKAGGGDLYWLLSSNDIPQDPGAFVVVPTRADADLDALSKMLGQFGNAVTGRKMHGALAFAGERVLKRLATAEADARPELAAAFAAAGGTPVQALLLPPKHTARVVEDLKPTLPAELGGGPLSVVTKGTRWAALGIDLAPKIAARLTIQSPDADSAAALEAWAKKLIALAGRNPDNREFLGAKPEEVFDLLLPKAAGDRVTLTVEADALLPKLLPAAAAARGRASEVQTANNARQILLACHQFADANAGKWPESLKALVDAKLIGADALRSPRRPGDAVGFTYKAPAGAVDASRIVLFESSPVWPGGGAIGFHDGHVEIIREQAEFEKRTK